MPDPTPIVPVYLRPEEIEYLEMIHEENGHDIMTEILRRAHAGQQIKKTK